MGPLRSQLPAPTRRDLIPHPTHTDLPSTRTPTTALPPSHLQGVYSHSLAEYCLTACNWFAKDLPRLRRQQVGTGSWLGGGRGTMDGRAGGRWLFGD